MIRCIWCEKQFYTVQDLLAHLKASHDRFLYSTPESKAIDSKMKINTIHIEVSFDIFDRGLQIRLWAWMVNMENVEF